MATRTSYDPGVPCWVDLGTDDPDGARAFYGDLFGWTFDIGGPEYGGYTMCLLDGAPVAGMMQTQSAEQPVAWSTYIATDDLDTTVMNATAAGATVIVEPMEVSEAGRMAFLLDPTGAAIGLWQAGGHAGSARVNEHGAVVWNELATRDLEAAETFYGRVFGWAFQPMEIPGMEYSVFEVDHRVTGGLMQMGDDWPEGVPPYWSVTFHVDDVDAASARAKELGATEHVGLTDTEYGRFTIVTDPAGAAFTLMQSAQLDP
jgi:predicted enzyme related to lactoylglutathione lyase